MYIEVTSGAIKGVVMWSICDTYKRKYYKTPLYHSHINNSDDVLNVVREALSVAAATCI